MQDPGYHSSTHQAPRDGWQQDKDARPRCAVCTPRPRALQHEDRPHRGRDARAVRLYPQEGR